MEKNIFTIEQQRYIAKGLQVLFDDDFLRDYFGEGILEWDPRRSLSNSIAELADHYVCMSPHKTYPSGREYTEVSVAEFSIFKTLHEAINILGNESILRAVYNETKNNAA